MVTRLYLIRHGDTVDEETKKIYKGRLDIPLSTKGAARMRQTAEFLSTVPLAAIYASSLSRCVESARIIANRSNKEIHTTDALQEIDFGAWEGMSFDEIAQEYPEHFEAWMKDPGIHTPPRGEPLEKVRQRVIAELQGIVKRHSGTSVAVVAHGGVLRMAICSLMGIAPSKLFSIGQDYGCISIVDVYKDLNVVLRLLNLTFPLGEGGSGTSVPGAAIPNE